MKYMLLIINHILSRFKLFVASPIIWSKSIEPVVQSVFNVWINESMPSLVQFLTRFGPIHSVYIYWPDGGDIHALTVALGFKTDELHHWSWALLPFVEIDKKFNVEKPSM